MIVLDCTCQYKQHVLSYDDDTEKYLNDLIEKNGQYKKVVYAPTGKAYKVPVAFILVHGIKASELDNYGFEEWQETTIVDSP